MAANPAARSRICLAGCGLFFKWSVLRLWYVRLMSRTVTLRLRPELVEAVQARALSDGVTVSEWIRRAIETYLDMSPVEKLDEFERRLARVEQAAGL